MTFLNSVKLFTNWKKKIRFAVIFWENPLLFSNWNPGACYLDLLMTCVNILQYICVNSASVLVLGIILNKISKHHGGLVFMNGMFLWWYPFLWQTQKRSPFSLEKKRNLPVRFLIVFVVCVCCLCNQSRWQIDFPVCLPAWAGLLGFHWQAWERFLAMLKSLSS